MIATASVDESGNLTPHTALLPWEREHRILNHLFTNERSRQDTLARRLGLCSLTVGVLEAVYTFRNSA